MARPARATSERGTALLEAIPVGALLLALILGVLTVAYLLFARAWVHSEGERGILCLAEQRDVSECRGKVRDRVARALPWGKIERLNLRAGETAWHLEMVWTWNGFTIRVTRKLDLKQILRSRDLRWSV